MTRKEIENLLNKYFEGETSLEEENRLRDYFLNTEVPDHFKKYTDLFRYFENAGHTEISVDDLLEQIPDEEAGSSKKPGSVIYWIARVAAVLIVLLIGFASGVIYQRKAVRINPNDISSHTQAVASVQDASWYNQIQKASSSEQIQLISQVEQDPKAGDLIIQTLITTLNTAGNVNVRMAAAEALFKMRRNPVARRALIQALPEQTDPNVQITLIDLLIRMNDKQAVRPMQVMLMTKNLDKVVRNKLEEGIGILS